MKYRFGLSLLCLSLLGLALAACQSPNPYSASSAPLPPAPPQAANQLDLSAYPAAPIDYARYRSWSWLQPPVAAGGSSPEQLQEVLENGLEQRGLRRAQSGSPADVQASASLRLETRQYQVQDDVGGFYGRGPYWGDAYGMYGSVPLLRTYERQVLVLRIDLYDARSGQPVWSGGAEADASGSQAQRSEALRQAVGDALGSYPPR
ncbi:DUF4136 domain-containing protein [Pseudomonas cavernae]|uniref:DUF4136 domain-containing protein n=1 Tax=Pseudomonas cavernae TaxID=2320867 RepID=A0A385Z6W9_9PSED|nr:DUF4136 domain-containing protein [Pseudomonas cavernae]AYC34461.1 DUF4136 domain-containing protein [Pseudomonas cavernae]